MVVKKTKHRLSVASTRIANKMRGRRSIHLLHIGKTGGTAIKHALRTQQGRVIAHPHSITTRDLPVGDGIVFFIREPVSRYVSGFYSRKRKGFPAHNKAWSQPERDAFEHFETPESLALAISCQDRQKRVAAEKAMRSIEHVRSSYWDWFGDPDSFSKRIPDIVFIGQQEALADDFDKLKAILDCPKSVTLSREPSQTHRAPEGEDRNLSEVALSNLRDWYAAEYVFTDACAKWRVDELGIPFDFDYSAPYDPSG